MTVGNTFYEVVDMQLWLGTDGDYEYTGRGQEIRLIQPTDCYNGHPVVSSSGFSPCPRCKKRTNIWWCESRTCDGVRTSKAHESICPRQE